MAVFTDEKLADRPGQPDSCGTPRSVRDTPLCAGHPALCGTKRFVREG